MAFTLETVADKIENEDITLKTTGELEDEYCEARYEEDHELYPDAVPLMKFLGEYLLGVQVKGNVYRICMADKGTAPEYVDGELKELPISLDGLTVRMFKGGGVFGVTKGKYYAYALSKNLWNTLTSKDFEAEHRAWLTGEIEYGEYIDGADRAIPSVSSTSDTPKKGIMPSYPQEK